MTTIKVRNDISVATLTRIVHAMEIYLELNDCEPIVEIIEYDVKDLRLILRPGVPETVWGELLDLDIENMPRNALKLIEEDL